MHFHKFKSNASIECAASISLNFAYFQSSYNIGPHFYQIDELCNLLQLAVTELLNMSMPIVQIANGRIRGLQVHSSEGYDYFAFRGIPYAEPPVDDLRFKDPVPIKNWTGIKDATTYGNMCRQYELTLSNFRGHDDCLFINVYTTSLKNVNKKKPVMVWIHGGGFLNGSSNDMHYGPDYLLRKDIVLVTFNYRLGVFGFLNLEDEVAPGNQGLKDQLLALKWVQQNIEVFGGDRNNVTIFGESSGSVSVHYLCLFHVNKGLFHKAISQSGTSYNNWARVKDPKKYAHLLCEVLGKKTKDPKEIMAFLRTVDSDAINKAQEEVKRSCEKLQNIFPFGPGIDDKSPDPYMSVTPEIEALKGVHIPYLIGHNDREGIAALVADPIFAALNQDKYAYIDANFERTIHPRGLDTLNHYNATPQDLRKEYFGDETISPNNSGVYIDMCGDLVFVEAVHRVLKIQAEKSKTPTYYYKFSYSGKISLTKALLLSSVTGACHFDEVEYLFYVNIRHKLGLGTLKRGTPGYRVMERMTEMWTNFATYGEPTPQKTNLLTEKWPPIDDGMNLRCLNINKFMEIETVENLEKRFAAMKRHQLT